jgi:hypothetical protein
MQDEKYDDCKPPYPPQGQCKGDPFTGGHNYAQNVTQNAQVALAAGTDFNLGAFYRCEVVSGPNLCQTNGIVEQGVAV